MKITLLEPLAFQKKSLARYQSRLERGDNQVHRLWREDH